MCTGADIMTGFASICIKSSQKPGRTLCAVCLRGAFDLKNNPVAMVCSPPWLQKVILRLLTSKCMRHGIEGRLWESSLTLRSTRKRMQYFSCLSILESFLCPTTALGIVNGSLPPLTSGGERATTGMHQAAVAATVFAAEWRNRRT